MIGFGKVGSVGASVVRIRFAMDRFVRFRFVRARVLVPFAVTDALHTGSHLKKPSVEAMMARRKPPSVDANTARIHAPRRIA